LLQSLKDKGIGSDKTNVKNLRCGSIVAEVEYFETGTFESILNLVNQGQFQLYVDDTIFTATQASLNTDKQFHKTSYGAGIIAASVVIFVLIVLAIVAVILYKRQQRRKAATTVTPDPMIRANNTPPRSEPVTSRDLPPPARPVSGRTAW